MLAVPKVARPVKHRIMVAVAAALLPSPFRLKDAQQSLQADSTCHTPSTSTACTEDNRNYKLNPKC